MTKEIYVNAPKATVLMYRAPASLVAREVVIAPTDIEQALRELKSFLRQAPYALGDPNPPGSLTLIVEGYRLYFGLRVHSQVDLKPLPAMSPGVIHRQMLQTNIPTQLHPLFKALIGYAAERGYALHSSFSAMLRPPRQGYLWAWGPAAGAENLYLLITYPTR
jgi:hypothetical protein